MPTLRGFSARIAPCSLSGVTSRVFGAALLLALPAALGGCNAIYDDTKGWANRLEASILKAAHDLDKDPDAQDAEHYTPEEIEPQRKRLANQNAAAAPAPGMAKAEPPAQDAAMPAAKKAPAVPPQAMASRQALLPEAPPPKAPDGLVGDAASSLLQPAKDAGPKKDSGPKKDADKAAAEPAGKKAETAKANIKTASADAKTAMPPKPKAKPARQTAKAAPAKQAKPAKAEAAEPAKAEETKPAQAATGVAMVLHLSSLRSEQAAKREWTDLKQTFPGPLEGLQAEIRRTELGEKGTFYRILAGPLPSPSAARQACAALKERNARQYCRVLPSQPAQAEGQSPS